MAEDEDKSDSRRMEAFDLVTEALEKIDAYQQSVAAHGRPAGKDLLISAERLLSEATSKAKEEDPEYFKAAYFQAMVAYLRSRRRLAISEFAALHDSIDKGSASGTGQHSIACEVNYNYGAALFAAKRYPEAITLFEETAGDPKADLEVQLLSRAGAALAHARAIEDGIDDKGKVKEHYRFIRKELAPFSFPQLIPLVRLLRGKKPIDKQVASKVREIVKDAMNPQNVSPSDGEDSDGQVTVT